MNTQSDYYLMASLVTWTAVFLAVGLWPFKFQVPRHWDVLIWPSTVNGVLNVVCFIPFGLLLGRLSFVTSPVLIAGIYCFVISISVECAQLFIPGRYSSLADLGANTFGGILGAIAVITFFPVRA